MFSLKGSSRHSMKQKGAVNNVDKDDLKRGTIQARIYRFTTFLVNDRLAVGITNPIFDEFGKIVGSFVVFPDDISESHIVGFIVGNETPVGLQVSLGDAFYFTVGERFDRAVISEIPLNGDSIKITGAIEEVFT